MNVLDKLKALVMGTVRMAAPRRRPRSWRSRGGTPPAGPKSRAVEKHLIAAAKAKRARRCARRIETGAVARSQQRWAAQIARRERIAARRSGWAWSSKVVGANLGYFFSTREG